MKQKKRHKCYPVFFILLVLGISTGYAFLNTILSVIGSIDVKGNTWDVYVDNVSIKSGSVSTTTPPINGDIESGITFVCSLMYPGDFYEFTVDIHNEGTVDAIIDSIDINPKLDDTQKGYINYTVEYQNGEQLAKNQLIKKGEFVRVKVRIEHRVDYTGSQTWFENIPGVIFINYVPDRGEGITVRDNGISKVIETSGNIEEVGTIVTIGSEQFYTIGTEGNNVKLLAKNNLYVGNIIAEGWGVTPIENTNGMQSEIAKGFDGELTADSYNFPFVGTTVFSNEENMGATEVDYTGSLVEVYVNNYKQILETNFSIEVVSARLLLKEEIEDEKFGCVSEETTCLGTQYPWIYSSTYWLGTALDPTTVFTVFIDGHYMGSSYNIDCFYGVRPVIIISKEYFE